MQNVTGLVSDTAWIVSSSTWARFIARKLTVLGLVCTYASHDEEKSLYIFCRKFEVNTAFHGNGTTWVDMKGMYVHTYVC